MFLTSIKLSFNLIKNTSFRLKLLDIKCFNNSINGLIHKTYYSSDEQNDKPVKYTTSAAHLKHKAYENFRFSEEELAEQPVYERPILIMSFVIFLIYFGILREPNDYDERLGAGLFETVPELELPLIEASIKNHEVLGLDTKELKKRFEELKRLKEELDNKKVD